MEPPADSPRGDRADVVVLGAGISGLVAASVLLDQGAARVVVVDDYASVGGNHLDSGAGGYSFDVGSLIFQDDSPLLAHFPELLPRYIPITPSWARLNPQGKVTAYPFSAKDDIVALGPVGAARILTSMIFARVRRAPIENARDFAERWLGPRFVESSGLAHYMHRLCGVPADQIDVEFARRRMGWIPNNGRLTTLAGRLYRAVRPAPPKPPSNTQLARPREGYAHLYEPAVERLEARGARFVLGAGMRALERDGAGGFVLRTAQGDVRAPRVVSTIPLDIALGLVGGDRGAVGSAPLPTVTLQSLYFSFSGHRGFDTSVLYNFSHSGIWKRLTVYSEFYGEHLGRSFFTVEVVGHGPARPAAEAAAAFEVHARESGLLDGDLRLEGDHVLEHAYPIYTRGSGDRARAAVAALEAFGIESFGRQGGFQYQPTARHSTGEVEAALGVRQV